MSTEAVGDARRDGAIREEASLQASDSLSGIANATDGGGVIQATVKNFVQTAY